MNIRFTYAWRNAPPFEYIPEGSAFKFLTSLGSEFAPLLHSIPHFASGETDTQGEEKTCTD